MTGRNKMSDDVEMEVDSKWKSIRTIAPLKFAEAVFDEAGEL